ncbi:MAG TPA: VOC family protein [Steroidobacteraceae bacterium]|nr:VOC family protein [Steroidobacteraceae bacterium]
MDRRSLLLGASTLAAFGASRVAEPEAPSPGMNPPKERVQGIGGLFFRSRDPKTLAEWYERHLGIDPTPTDYDKPVWNQAAGPTVFAPFPMDTKYFGAPQQAWMVNFRVRSLDAMVAQLRASSIAVDVDTQVYPNGRFARLHDPDGNPIELWEPGGRTSQP